MLAVDIFKEIANNVPRCSFHAKPMKEWIIKYSRNLGYEVLEDDAGNLLARKTKHAQIALQSHYDIVCVGPQPPKLIEKDGWISAPGSSIGADNGVGVGLMLSLMNDFDNLEYLFTNDEEVGLLGAKNLDLNINARKLLNFDGFEEGQIVIGCAGSVRVKLSTNVLERGDIPKGYKPYEISIQGLPGGHSGLDIDKDIPSAISKLLLAIKQVGGKVSHISGGEKLNSIPTKAKATIWAKPSKVVEMQGFEINALENALPPYKDCAKLLKAMLGIKHGVFKRDIELGVVETSANFALIKEINDAYVIEVYIRSMKNKEQEKAAIKIVSAWEKHGFIAEKLESHTAWTPYMSGFALDLKVAMKPFYHQAGFMALHAGLECAIFHDKFPGIELASIGPNIRAAHSAYERLETASLDRTEELIRAFLSRNK